MSTTKRWLLASDDPGHQEISRRYAIRNRMECRDGFSMSVQYSTAHYCNGRKKFMGGDMEHGDDPLPEPRTVEVGFPSQREPLLRPYAEEWTRPLLPCPHSGWQVPDWSRPWLYRLYRWLEWVRVPNATNTVYGWVPIEVVDQVIAKHGGLKD